MGELHIIGQIESASGFPDPKLFCCWELHHGGGWRVLGGQQEGQTQTDLPVIEETAYFAHPIDVHLSTRTIQGWPSIHLQVWHQDSYGRQEVYGYGMCQLPTQPGEHEITCPTWRLAGTFREEVLSRFVGGGLQTRSVESIFNSPLVNLVNQSSSGSPTSSGQSASIAQQTPPQVQYPLGPPLSAPAQVPLRPEMPYPGPTSPMVPAQPLAYVRLIGPYGPFQAAITPAHGHYAPASYDAAYHLTSTPANQSSPYLYPANQQPAPASLSYTEHWANQLPTWHDQSDTSIFVPRTVSSPQSKTAVVPPLIPVSSRLTASTLLDSPSRADRSLDAQGAQQLPVIDSLSTITGPSSIGHRRRPITDEDEWERQAKLMEQKLTFDEQIAEKRRLERLREEKERRENEEVEKERRRLELRQRLEDEAELNKWKLMRDAEQRREDSVLAAWEKAKNEAKMVRKARIMSHAWDADSPDPTAIESPPKQNGVHQQELSDMEEALKLAKSIERRAKLDREMMESSSPRQPVAPQKPKSPEPPAAHVSRSKSLPPVTAETDNRPIRPQMQDPLELWTRMAPSEPEPINGEHSPPPKAPPRRMSKKDRRQSEGTVASNGTYTVDEDRPPFVPEPPPKSATVKPVRRPGVSPVRYRPDSKPSNSPKTDEKPRLLNKRPSIDRVLTSSGDNGKSSSGDENPWGDSLGGLNPLYQPLVTRRKKRSPEKPAETAEISPSQPVKAVHAVSPLRANENRPLAREKTPALDDCLGRKKPAPAPDSNSFNLKRSPLHSSINAKRPMSGRQKQILDQLSALRQQLKSKQREVEESLLNNSRTSSENTSLA